MPALRWPAGLALGLGPAGAAWAHDTGASHQEPPGWTLDPWIVVPLLIVLALFAIGWKRLSARANLGADRLAHRARLFGAGWLVLAAALVSPLHEAGERSFAAHMFEHELIMLAAAPLLVLSEPLAIMLWAFPAGGRRGIGAVTTARLVQATWHFLSAPLVATLVQAAALWLWHAPPLFDLALASDGWHAAQHLSFLVSALFFWSAMLSRRTPVGVAALCLVATSVVSGALGALMALATSPWYAGYARLGLSPYGLTPAEDQQVAGLLMWVPGGLVHAGAALLVMRRLLRPAHA
ncbi:MAG: cytochrome c oxidase assembly protein [Sphingomonas sp.]|uniref:cytochrome c oxidase assembly protein n=1 Tax=Sphingomonas sp. TaxID=28214 RepID=UPI001215E197|nr:cytochrome c oxidase assembly protein [Sphingomonas sp.]THD34602.1 MAG: cytochrome c oxidase assembly protein [Sphingomonas sp.]